MAVRVVREGETHRLEGQEPVTEVANAFLAHLQARGFAAGTVCDYAYDLLNLSRFLRECELGLDEAGPMDLFDWLELHPLRQPLRLAQTPPPARPGSSACAWS